ncbi:hypothetical protein MHBO_001252 [Bonamia ostreae]|uniref:Uncharacterized protein n=1 Tax=Bonamia ostreae TaxID=126728 RepID=A0ABV2AIA5_9EUKA
MSRDLSKFIFVRNRLISASNTIGILKNSTIEEGAKACLLNKECASFDYAINTKTIYLNEKQNFPLWGENAWNGDIEAMHFMKKSFEPFLSNKN